MIVKKYKGTIYGGELTASERKAMDLEIQKELSQYERKHINETDAIALYVALETFRCSKKKLKEYYIGFDTLFRELLDRYEMDVSDGAWLCTRKLKQMGIDIEEWAKEIRGK